MEHLEALVRTGKEIGFQNEELQAWIKEEQDFLIGEQKWCKDMIELKEKRLMIQAEEIKELKDTVEKMKDERDNIEKRHNSEMQKMKEELVNMKELMSKNGENETDLQNKYTDIIQDLKGEVMSLKKEKYTAEQTQNIIIEKLNNEIEQMKEEVMNVKEEKYTAEQKKNITIEKLNNEVEQMKGEVMNLKEEKFTAEQTKNITIEKVNNEIEQMKKEKTILEKTQNTMMQKLRDELTEVKRVKIVKEQKEVTMRSIPKGQIGESGSGLEGRKSFGTSNIDDRCNSEKYQNALTANRYKMANSNSKKTCYKCGSSGHLIKHCDYRYKTLRWNYNYRRTNRCEICKKTCHDTSDCWFRNQRDGERTCFRCSSAKHLVKNSCEPRKHASSMITRTSSEPSCEIYGKEYDGYQTRQEENFRTLIINTVMESFRHFRKSFRERQSEEEVNLLHVRDTGVIRA